MITRLQTIFLKHNKFLFGGLLVVIIVTFVLTIGPQSFFGSGGGQGTRSLNYFGYDLTSDKDQRAMAMGAEISAILNPQLQLRDQQLKQYSYMRVAALGLAEQLGIPRPSDEALKAYIETLLIFRDPQTGEFSADMYNRMVGALESSSRYSKESLGIVLREDYRINEVRNALGGPGYSLPFEIKQDYIERKTVYSVELAHLSYEDFSPEIETSDEALEQFYRENPKRYEIPETLLVTALQFRAAAYIDEVPDPTEEQLQAFFEMNKARYAAQQNSSEEEEKPELTLEAMRETVTKDWMTQQARGIAARKSESFSVRLWKESIERESEAFADMLKEYKVETIDVPPYSRNLPPNLPAANSQLLNSMWVYANNPTRYYSDIAETAEGAVILIRRGITEARLPDFWEVRDQVAQAYTETEKRRLFSEKGTEIEEAIQSRLDGESFEEIATSLNLKFEKLDSFKGENPPQELLRSALWDQTRSLDSGDISTMVLQPDQGSFAYMVEKEVPAIDEESEEYQEYLAQQNTRSLGESLGWSRLREISDQTLESLVGTSAIN